MTENPRPLIAWTIAMAALAVVIMAALYISRDALIIIYISALIAIGFGPVVRAIEHQSVVPVGTKGLPRWLAILVVYSVILGVLAAIAAMVVPPLVDQASTIGASSAIGLYLLGVPYFYVLALISAFGELIPVVGPILSSIPAIGAALTVSPRTAFWVVIFFILQA